MWRPPMLLLKPDPRMCILVPPAKLPALGPTLVISTGCEHAGTRNARSITFCRSTPDRRPIPSELHLVITRGKVLVCYQTPTKHWRVFGAAAKDAAQPIRSPVIDQCTYAQPPAPATLPQFFTSPGKVMGRTSLFAALLLRS
jgi:hypothetical protein